MSSAQPPCPKRNLANALCALGLVGLFLSLWLTFIHYRVYTDLTYEAFCVLGGAWDCASVAASPYSVLLGLPVSVWGILAFLVASALAFSYRLRSQRVGLLLLVSAGLAGGSVFLAALSAFAIGTMCLLCTAVYATSLLIFILAILETRRTVGVFRALQAELDFARRRPLEPAGSLLIAVLAVALLEILATRYAYWQVGSFRGGPRLPHGTLANGSPWLGASNPRVVVHEYFDFECPHCKAAHVKLRRILERNANELRIVRHEYARMACLFDDQGPKAEDDQRCIMVRAAYCASKMDRYWEWNDAALAHPKPPSGPKRRGHELFLASKLKMDASFVADCMKKPDAYAYAEAQFKASKQAKVRLTPSYRVDGRTVTLAGIKELLK